MTTPTRQPHNRVSVNGEPARRITGGDIVLDALTVPYGVATAVYDLQPGDTDDADPRDDIRVVLTCSSDGGATVRPFDLGIRDRSIDHTAKTVELTLATDEALLMDYAPLADDTSQKATTSLRALVNYVLGTVIPGAALAATPANDDDVTAQYAVTNLFPNPSAEVDLIGWAISSGASALTAVNASGVLGAKVVKWTAAAGTAVITIGWNGIATTGKAPRVQPGRTYTAQVWLQGAAATPVNVKFDFRTEEGVYRSSGKIVTGTLVTSGWAKFTITADAPSDAAYGIVVITTTGNAANTSQYADAAMVYAGADPISAFDGSTPADARYAYAWESTAHASPSVRTPTEEQPLEALIWRAGVTAWDFLQPHLTRAGLRLFCDETRVWRLINPTTYLIPGFVRVTGKNATEGMDLTSRWDPEVFATGVVVRYSWIDANGIPQTAHDSAGTPNKVFVVEYQRPYPGPGAAAAILARRDGTGRVQAVTGLMNWDATPSMTASVTMPFTVEQQGKVSSVAFSLGDDATMQVGTAGLIEIPPGSIDALDGTIDGLVGTIDNLNPIARRP